MASRKKTAKKSASRAGKERSTGSYAHPEASALLRPDAGTQAQFRKKKPPATWRYDPSLSPALDWAGKPSGSPSTCRPCPCSCTSGCPPPRSWRP